MCGWSILFLESYQGKLLKKKKKKKNAVKMIFFLKCENFDWNHQPNSKFYVSKNFLAKSLDLNF